MITDSEDCVSEVSDDPAAAEVGCCTTGATASLLSMGDKDAAVSKSII